MKKENRLTIVKKLNNKHGVSILFAMMLFLVVAMVSVVIIASSYTSVKRTNSIKDTKQDVLTLESAALLLKNNINNVEVIITDNGNDYVNPSSNLFTSYIVPITRSYYENNSSMCNLNIFDISQLQGDYSATVKVVNSCEYENISGGEDDKVMFTLTLDDSNEKIYVTFDITLKESSTTSKTYIWSGFKASNKNG